MNAFGKGNVDLTKDILGVDSPASRDEIIDYVHGYDAWDEDGDTITDGDSVVWTILSAKKTTLGTRWRCISRKQR